MSHFDLVEEAKKAFIIIGPGATGSVFISKIISYVVGKSKKFGDWDGYGQLGKVGDEIICIHKSQPSGLKGEMVFASIEKIKEKLIGYELYFIITTRDMSCSLASQISRKFPAKKGHYIKSKEILSKVIQNERFFIWNYETFVYLKEVYLYLLYNFLEVSSDFVPGEIKDGNKKYFSKKRRRGR
jgi:hypothetical protein